MKWGLGEIISQASCNKFEVLRNQNHNLLENIQKKGDVKLNKTDNLGFAVGGSAGGLVTFYSIPWDYFRPNLLLLIVRPSTTLPYYNCYLEWKMKDP